MSSRKPTHALYFLHIRGLYIFCLAFYSLLKSVLKLQIQSTNTQAAGRKGARASATAETCLGKLRSPALLRHSICSSGQTACRRRQKRQSLVSISPYPQLCIHLDDIKSVSGTINNVVLILLISRKCLVSLMQN